MLGLIALSSAICTVCVYVCVNTIANCFAFKQRALTTCHFVTANCGRVYMCVFLLSTARHRNGKPVSTVDLFSVNLKPGRMLHVTKLTQGGTWLWYCASPFVKPRQPCHFLGFEQLMIRTWQKVMSPVGHGGAGFTPLHACVSHPSTLPHFVFVFCFNYPLSVPQPEPYSVYSICLFEKNRTPPPHPSLAQLCPQHKFNVLFETCCFIMMPDMIKMFVSLKWSVLKEVLGACRYFPGTQLLPVDF